LIQPLTWGAIAFFLITSSTFVNLLNWGLTVQLPPDLGDRVDTIVVLGRGENFRAERIAVAWQLWKY
jgi:hypothetical protein